MNFHRVLIVIMISIQAASIYLMSQTKIFPLVSKAIAFSSLVISYRFTIDQKSRQRLFIMLVFAFIIKHIFYRPHFTFDRIFIGTPGCLTIAQFLMTLQLFCLFIKLKQNQFSIRYVGLGFCLLVCTSNYYVTLQERMLNQWIVGLFIITAAYFLHTNRPYVPNVKKPGRIRRQLHIIVILSFIVSTSATTGWLSYRYETIVNSFIAKYLRSRTTRQVIGNHKKKQLGSVEKQQISNGDNITLRIYSDDIPGYLRGQTFDKFSGKEWIRTNDVSMLNPSSTDNETMEHIYELDSIPKLAYKKFDIWPAAGHNEILYTPQNRSRLKTCINELNQDLSGSIWTREPMEAEPYTVITSKPNQNPQLHKNLRRKLLDAGNIDPRIDQVAREVFIGCYSVEEKIQAVEEYFKNNYKYKLGIQIPNGEHPLVHFLTKKPAAHCEYFASATVILLRTAGVACRYTTGYIAFEQNEIGGYWVARNKNAHAWVEAFIPEKGWTIVESTPEDGIPSQATESQSTSQIYDMMQSWIQQFRINLRKYGFLWIFWKLISVLQYTFISMLVGLILFIAIIKHLKKYRRTEPVKKLSISEIQLKKLLKKMDRRLTRIELKRDPNESLQQFIKRIESAFEGQPECESISKWYKEYSKIRYSSRQDKINLDHLKESMPTVNSKIMKS